MNCDREENVLQCYFDNELDPLEAAEFERHLRLCPECVVSLDALKSLRSAIGRAQLYERTPASLHSNIVAALDSADSNSGMPGRAFWAARRVFWKSAAFAAAVLLAVGIGWRAASIRPLGNDDTTLLASEIVDAHLRSLQPGHLDDVISSDQHTVKPWFNGKLDFSPPVRDLSSSGFPLQGARLDIIHGRTVAALVYARRKHLVNVFVWPTNEPKRPPREGSRQGYQWLDWRAGGMELFIVSDANRFELEQLQRILGE